MSAQQRLRQQFPYRWRVKTRRADRFGQRCAVLTRGAMNSCLVEFPDGERIVTSRFFVRRSERLEEAAIDRKRRSW